MAYRYRRPTADRYPSCPVAALFARCERAQIRICVLRDADRVDQPQGGEIDLLAGAADLDRLRTEFNAAGFVELASPADPLHHFFILYEPAMDRWTKCDVVTSIAYGRGRARVHTNLAASCLDGRVRQGGIYVLRAEDEFVTLLLHEMLDKRQWRPHRTARLQQLRSLSLDHARLTANLLRYWPGMTSDRLARHIEDGAWTLLSAARHDVAQGLRQGGPLQGRPWIGRSIGRALATLSRLISPQAPAISLLAPDGAGKSTLIESLSTHFFGHASAVYMGLHQHTRRRLSLPGLGFAATLARQWRRYLCARYRQAHGHLVLFDRYNYDALIPSGRPLDRWSRLRRAILARSCPAPDLSIVLDAPGTVLFERKHEHTAAWLERQRQGYLDLQRLVPRVIVVDAARPAADVRRTVMSLVWERYRHGRLAPAHVIASRA
jgi:thymidylate kinase